VGMLPCVGVLKAAAKATRVVFLVARRVARAARPRGATTAEEDLLVAEVVVAAKPLEEEELRERCEVGHEAAGDASRGRSECADIIVSGRARKETGTLRRALCELALEEGGLPRT
jgi:hypothetical protein